MSPTQHDAVPGFTFIAPTIWEHIPPSLPHSEKPASSHCCPQLILLFSWTGAQGRHVEKYATRYQDLFPSSTILVISTSIKDLCFRSPYEKQQRLQPAIEQIRSYGPVGRVLIHCFSEGGSNKAVEFAEAYQKVVGKRLQCDALCLDSTPGHPRYKRLCAAMKKSLPPNRILRASGMVIGAIVLGGFWVAYGVFKGRNNNVISKTRARLLDEGYWDLSAPRCYIYSKEDELIKWEDVQEHARETAEKGVPVAEVCYDKSAHCKHMAEDSLKYWDIIIKTWRQGLGEEPDEKGTSKPEDMGCSAMVYEWVDNSSERTLAM
ncbi:hypothetical protein BCR34DRAFT_585789 [Clohesyomyces aquaticus]|uniref:Indole-diterpene biosynthesis protein-like protein PaxU n=1 Tax=Clohesyomyces aquaticus TaxID=1231657 RepID=A0A1Y1ZVU8_9PLEO|nr:hypothetical protein BCR34DRAFT_585789 [Clohesyomyces aquaticus]